MRRQHSDELVCVTQTEKLTSLTELIKKPISRTREAARAWCKEEFPCSVTQFCSKIASLPWIGVLKSQWLTWEKHCGKWVPHWMVSLFLHQLSNLPQSGWGLGTENGDFFMIPSTYWCQSSDMILVLFVCLFPADKGRSSNFKSKFSFVSYFGWCVKYV